MTNRQPYLTDSFTVEDHLHFSDFTPALLGILEDAQTPLTVGVYGAWGSGKTSLLRMLHDEIKAKDHAYVRPVWFTAWKYDRQEALWRAFMLRIIDALYPRDRAGERLVSPDSENQKEQVAMLDRLEMSIYQPVDWQEMGKLMVNWAQLGKKGAGAAFEVAKLFVPGAGLVESLVKKAGALNDDEQVVLKRKMQSYYRQQLVEMEQFESAFAEAIELILGSGGHKGRLIVFVDDLDRCMPEKVIEVLEAIKLFLSVPGVVFVLGMDRDVVQKGIEARYGAYFGLDDVAREELPIRGDVYLQKLIQIPFHLPPLAVGDLDQFIGDLEDDGGERLSELTRRVFAEGLFPNPRQVKRALNIFQLLKRIAEVRQQSKDADGKPRLGQIDDALLAKTVVIQTQYPMLYQDWRRYPTLVQVLEEAMTQQPLSDIERVRGRRKVTKIGGRGETVEDSEDASSGGIMERYLNDREKYALLERMLRYPEPSEGGGKTAGRFAKLEITELRAYVQLAGSVAATETPAFEAPPDLMGALLSNEWVRINDAIEQLDEKDKADPKPLRQALIGLIQQGSLEPKERVSVGLALAKLGDTRPGVAGREPEMIAITEKLRFAMGENEAQRQDVTIDQPYEIAKYPVTNAQYRFFVEGRGYTDKQILAECWSDEGRQYIEKESRSAPAFWDEPIVSLDNMPVIGVSYFEAEAYAAWLAKVLRKPCRLPTEAEWERAARGPNGREYPWGKEWIENIAHTKELGINQPSAVGCFSANVSEEGVFDLAGNVWEWCQGVIVKGGSWLDDKEEARCGARYRSHPDLRDMFGYLGFRIVVSPI